MAQKRLFVAYINTDLVENLSVYIAEATGKSERAFGNKDL